MKLGDIFIACDEEISLILKNVLVLVLASIMDLFYVQQNVQCLTSYLIISDQMLDYLMSNYLIIKPV